MTAAPATATHTGSTLRTAHQQPDQHRAENPRSAVRGASPRWARPMRRCSGLQLRRKKSRNMYRPLSAIATSHGAPMAGGKGEETQAPTHGRRAGSSDRTPATTTTRNWTRVPIVGGGRRAGADLRAAPMITGVNRITVASRPHGGVVNDATTNTRARAAPGSSDSDGDDIAEPAEHSVDLGEMRQHEQQQQGTRPSGPVTVPPRPLLGGRGNPMAQASSAAGRAPRPPRGAFARSQSRKPARTAAGLRREPSPGPGSMRTQCDSLGDPVTIEPTRKSRSQPVSACWTSSTYSRSQPRDGAAKASAARRSGPCRPLGRFDLGVEPPAGDVEGDPVPGLDQREPSPRSRLGRDVEHRLP